MMWKDYKLDDKVLELDEDVTLYRSDKVLVNLSKGARAIAVKRKDRMEGLVFQGHGRLIVDTIVETENGALGKPTERELSEPFLMLGPVEDTLQHLKEANKEDLQRNGVKAEDLFDKAQNLVDKLQGRHALCSFSCYNEQEGSVFAFATDEDRLDVLVLNDSRIVFKSKGVSFVSIDNHSVLKNTDQVVLATNGRSVFVRRPSHHNQVCCLCC
jgi:hypothetical protein